MKCVAENKSRVSFLIICTPSDTLIRRSLRCLWRRAIDIAAFGNKPTTSIPENCSKGSFVVRSPNISRKTCLALISDAISPGNALVKMTILEYVLCGRVDE